MTGDVSVAKGVFVRKNGFKRSSKRCKNTKREKSMFSNCLWYQQYNSLWKNIEAKLHIISSEMFANTLEDLVRFVARSCEEKLNEVPTAALLTGINMPDHEVQFSTLSKEIKENVSPHCVTLSAEDGQNLKLLIESMVDGFVNNIKETFEGSDEELNSVKKSSCNFSVLQAWYEDLYMNESILNYSETSWSKKRKNKSNRRILAVIIPDLENFNETIIQDFILIAHSYINILPIVIIFGVATSLTALHRSLPYHVSSKINIKVFSSEPCTVYLNNVVENVFLDQYCPFSLGGKVFNLFTDLFLFYDFSVTGFIKNFKYAMMEHFSQGNVSALCTNDSAEDILNNFTHDDFENLRKLYSFRDLIVKENSFKNRIRLFEDDDYLMSVVIEKIQILKKYRYFLHLFIRCLHILVKDLPRTPLGRQIRELYATVTSENIAENQYFKECFLLLKFQAKDVFCEKLNNILIFFEKNLSKKFYSEELRCMKKELEKHLEILKGYVTNVEEELHEDEEMQHVFDRKLFKENLKKMTQDRSKNCEKFQEKTVDYLKSIFEIYLFNYTRLHFHEIFFFNDISIQNQLLGTHRAAIHTALHDPHYYLKCRCCKIKNSGTILPTMPDISIAYKLHLECGKLINLYDWFQAFLSILNPLEDESKRKVDPELQARFTQAVVELEYLGFIKSSKRKTDHVQRLTWGG